MNAIEELLLSWENYEKERLTLILLKDLYLKYLFQEEMIL